MRASVFVGRVGGLALALGVGLGLSVVCGGPVWAAPDEGSADSATSADAPGSGAGAVQRSRAGRGTPVRSESAEAGSGAAVARGGGAPARLDSGDGARPAAVHAAGGNEAPAPQSRVAVEVPEVPVAAGGVQRRPAGGVPLLAPSADSGEAPAAGPAVIASPVAAPVEVAVSGTVQSAPAPPTDVDPSAPVGSALSFALLAAARRQGGSPGAGTAPAAAVTSAQVVSPTNVTAPRAYVTNFGSNSVSVIDTATNTVVRTISDGIGYGPAGVAVNPAGTLVFVPSIANGTVSVINAATGVVSSTVTVGKNPVGVAFSADGTRAYVANGGEGTLSVVDASAAKPVELSKYTVGDGPGPVAVFGSTVYVANNAGDSVSVINTVSKTVQAITGVSAPAGLAINPTGTLAYVTSQMDNTVAVIDTATRQKLFDIPVGSNPSAVAFNAAGTRAYVANFNDGTVSVIDTGAITGGAGSDLIGAPSAKVIATIGVGAETAHQVAVTSVTGGDLVYVTTPKGVTVINTAKNNALSYLTTGDNPAGVAFGGSSTVAATPTLRIADASIVEGQTGTKTLDFAVTLSSATPTSAPVTVNWATKDGPVSGGATVADKDYTAGSGTLTFPKGTTTQTQNISVILNGDVKVESDETFTVTLTSPPGVTLDRATATGTITNDDTAPPVRMSIDAVSVTEGKPGEGTWAEFKVSFTGAQGAGPVTVKYYTAEGSATAGKDFEAVPIGSPVLLDFKIEQALAAGDTVSKIVRVKVLGDAESEPDEQFFVALTDPVGAILARPSAIGTIKDDDTAANVTNIAVGKSPIGVAVSPDGKRVYVANYDGKSLSVINTELTLKPDTKPATVSLDAAPLYVAFGPTDSTKVYVSAGSFVQAIDTKTNTVTSAYRIWEEGFGSGSARGLAVNSKGVIYAANSANFGKVSVITPTASPSTVKINTGANPYVVALSPNGSNAYVTNYKYDVGGSVSVINTTTNVVSTVTVGGSPQELAATATKVFASSAGSNAVSVIEVGTNKVSTITGFFSPRGVAVSPDGTRAYVANQTNNTVSVINTATNAITEVIPVGAGPIGVAVGPGGRFVYVTNNGGNSVSVIDTTVKPGNRSPIAGKPTMTTDTAGKVSGTVNAIDPDGDTPIYKVETIKSAKGTFAITDKGAFTYTPLNDQVRHAAAKLGATADQAKDIFTVTVSDGRGGSATVPVEVMIAGKNAAPTLASGGGFKPTKTDSATGAVTGTVTGVTDADGDKPTFSGGFSSSRGGGVAFNSDGTITYTPTLALRQDAAKGGTFTQDTFTVVASDGYGGRIEIPVSVTISATTQANRAPIAGKPSLSTRADTGGVYGSVNATDPDGDTLKYTKATVTSSLGVKVSIDENGNFTYLPDDKVRHAAAKNGAVKTDAFSVTVTDGRSNPVQIAVTGVPVVTKNTAPAAPKGDALSVTSTDIITGKVVGKITGVTDADGDTPITYSLSGNSSVQTPTALWSITPDGTLTYTPNDAARLAAGKATTDAQRYDTYSVTADDGYGGKASIPVKIFIQPKYADYTTVATVGGFKTVDDVTFSPDGTIAFISDGISGQVTAVIGSTGLKFPEKLPIAADSIAISSDFSRVYFTDARTGQVSVYDWYTEQVTVVPGDFGSAEVEIVADRVYVTSVDTVSIIDTKTNKVTATITRQPDPRKMSYGDALSSPDGRRLYVADPVDNVIRIYDTTGSKPREIGRISPTATPGQLDGAAYTGASEFGSEMRLSPDGRYLYVTELRLQNSVGYYGYSRQILMIDTQDRNRVVATLPADDVRGGSGPAGAQYMALSPDGKRLFVANPELNSVTVYDTSGRPPKNLKTFGGLTVSADGKIMPAEFSRPTSLKISADGTRLYVTNSGNSTVSVVSIAQPTSSGTNSGGGTNTGGGSNPPDFVAPK